MLFNKNDRLLYLSHIPKTGGRYFTELLKHSGYLINSTDKQMLQTGTAFNQEEFMHLTLLTAKKFYYNFNKCQKITVIRNPVSRFVSCINSQYFLNGGLGGNTEGFQKMEDEGYFDYMMKERLFTGKLSDGIRTTFNGLANLPTNWFKKQVQFFDCRFAIWKYENGLDQDFYDFLSDNCIDIDNKVRTLSYTRNSSYDDHLDGFSLSAKLKKNILKYYEEDYDFWSTFNG